MPIPPQNGPTLTSRERQVLKLIADGRTNREIATHFCLSVNTVQNHVKHILKKLAARNRTHAGAIYYQQMTDSSH